MYFHFSDTMEVKIISEWLLHKGCSRSSDTILSIHRSRILQKQICWNFGRLLYICGTT
jgi:hypothetical protein